MSSFIQRSYFLFIILMMMVGCGSPSQPAGGCATDSVAAEPFVANRIICSAPLLTEVVFALGQEHRLVGRTDYCKYPEAAQQVASVGSVMDPSIETIIDLKPDVVLTSTHFKREVSDKLNRLAFARGASFTKAPATGLIKPFAM